MQGQAGGLFEPTKKDHKMSYDFKPTYHIGMTPEGYHINGAKKQNAKKPKPKQIAQHLTTWIIHLEDLMLAGDTKAEAILKAFYDRKYNARYLGAK